MTLRYRDRVVDVSTTTGTGTLTLGALPPAGYRAFSAFPTGSTIRYTIVHENNTEWEVGEGVWTTSGATLTRVKVFASSNADSLVNFTAGNKTVSASPVARDVERPAFRAHRTTAQTVTANTWAKVQPTTEVFDTGDAYDATTNFRFQPAVAGYYQINGQVNVSSPTSRLIASIYKNGTQYAIGGDYAPASLCYRAAVADLVYLNGSTDYVELYGYTSGTTFNSAGSSDVYFSGVLVAPSP